MARKLKQAGWSYAEDRRLLKLAKSLKSPEEIARRMNRSPAAVYKMAIRLGVPFKAP
jgi:ribosomal protein L13E